MLGRMQNGSVEELVYRVLSGEKRWCDGRRILLPFLSFHVGLLLVLSSFPRFPYLFHHGFVSVSAIMCVRRWQKPKNVGAKLKQKPNNGCDGQTKGRWFLCESYIAPNSNRVVFDDKDCEVKFLRTSKRARNFEAKNQSASASASTIRIGLKNLQQEERVCHLFR